MKLVNKYLLLNLIALSFSNDLFSNDLNDFLDKILVTQENIKYLRIDYFKRTLRTYLDTNKNKKVTLENYESFLNNKDNSSMDSIFFDFGFKICFKNNKDFPNPICDDHIYRYIKTEIYEHNEMVDTRTLEQKARKNN